MYRKSKKLLAWALVVCMIVTQMLFSSVALAADKASLATDRFAGADRYATAIEVSKAGWTTSQYAVLAYGEGFADALAAAPLAKKLNAPILLTDKGALSAGVLAELQRLGVDEVYIVGGEGVVAKAVEDAVLAAGMDVTRLWGTDRYQTALAVAEEMGTPDTVFLAYGENYADALSVSAIAAAKGWPVLLTGTGAIDADVKAYIGSKKVYVVGGAGVVGDAVLNQFSGAVRLGGVDRYDTNLKVLEQFAADLNFLNVFMATGEGFADALAGSVLAANYASPLVLVGTSVAPATLTFLAGKVTSETGVFAFGGTAVVSNSALASVNPTTPSGVLAVESVTAVDLNQVKVVFTKELDETSAETVNYYEYNGVALNPTNDRAVLQSDKKTVLVTFDTAGIKGQYEEGIFKVKKNCVYSKDYMETVPAYEKTLTFSDTAVPTVTGVKASGNKKITVTFSEPVLAGALSPSSNWKIDGQSLANFGYSSYAPKDATTAGYANQVEVVFGVALPSGAHTLTVPAGSGADLKDAAGYYLVKTDMSFEVTSVTGAPKVVSVTGSNNGTLYVTYDREMDSATAENRTNYTMNGVAASSAGFKSGTGNTVVKVVFGSVAKGANVVEINKGIKDVWGNKLDPDNNIRQTFTAEEDKTAPTVTSVVLVDNKTIRVKFSEDVNDSYATNRSNYKLKDNSGLDITANIANPLTKIAGDTYELKSGVALTKSDYTLEIKNIVDLAATPNTIVTYTATFNGVDDENPTVVEAVVAEDGASPHKVAIFYSEKMTVSTIIDKLNYKYIDGAGTERALPGGATIASGESDKSVIITFPSSFVINGGSGNEYSVIQIRVSNVKDVAGNTLAGVSALTGAIKAYNAGTSSKPNITVNSFNLYDESSTQIRAEFEMNQTLTKLAIADFAVQGKAPVSGYVAGKKVVLYFDNTVDGTTLDTIRVAGNNATLVTVAAASENAAGTKITLGINEKVYEDQLAPRVKSVTMGADAKKIKVTFSEAIDHQFVGDYKDDFTVTCNGTINTIESVTIVAGSADVILNLKDALTGNTVVKANATTASIKDYNKDGAETATLWVPSTADKDGYSLTVVATAIFAQVTPGAAAVPAATEVNTLTISGTGTAGTSNVTFNDGTINVTVPVAIAAADTAAQMAAKAQVALAADAFITAAGYAVTNAGGSADVVFTAGGAAADKNVVITVTPGTGGMNGTAVQTTAGNAGSAAVAEVNKLTFTSAASKAGNITVSFTDGTITKDVVVAVLATDDTAAKVAAKVQVALAADATINAVYTVTNAAGSADVIFTTTVAGADKPVSIVVW